MAANVPQMAGNGQFMAPQNNQRQLQALVYNHMMNNPTPLQGWQAAIGIPERMGKAVNLISSTMLAMPGADFQKAATFGVDFEKKALLSSPDRQSYEQAMQAKTAEMARRREANAPNLQSQLNAEAARQAQAQQHQMLLQAQMAARGMAPQAQQPFQHLGHPMQVSQIPQTPQQMGMGMVNLSMQQTPPNQQPFQMSMPPSRQPGAGNVELGSLTPQDRAKVMEYANQLYNGMPEEQKQNLRTVLQSKLAPQQLSEIRASGRDILISYCQQQALLQMQKQAQQRMLQQRQGGMPPNANQAQGGIQLGQGQPQPKQQPRQMNPAMTNAMGQQPGVVPGGQLFTEIVNGQKAGLLAEQAGQMVVPASSGPGRNATPQPMAGMAPQNMQNTQPGPGANQQQRPPQMGPAFNMAQAKMDQAAAQSQAQIKAQAAARQMGNQPGPTSQSPGMSTLNAGMTHPPVAMAGQANGPRVTPGNPAMGQALDPRFNHQGKGRPISMAGNINVNAQAFHQMLNSLTPEQRQTVGALPPERLREFLASWQERNPMNTAGQPQNQAHRLGQPQGSITPMNGTGQFAGTPAQPPNAPAAANMVAQMAARTRPTAGAPNHAQAQQIMDSMDIPVPLLQQMRNAVPHDIKKWGQLKAWLPQSNLLPQTQQQLLNLQVQQFRQIMERRAAAASAAQQGPLAGGQQAPAGAVPPHHPQQQQQQQVLPNFPPGMQIPQPLQVTAHDIEMLRRNPKCANYDDNTLMKVAMKMKQEQIRKMQAQMQQQQAQMQHPAKNNQSLPLNHVQPGQGHQPAAVQPDLPAAQPSTSQSISQKPAQAVPDSNQARTKATRPAQTRPGPTPSPAQAQKAIKRPHPADGDEAPNTSAATNQRPTSQAGVRPPNPPPQPTPEQLAAMSPEQRQKWEQMLRSRQQVHPSAEDINRLRFLSGEELRLLQHESMPEIAMTDEEKSEIRRKIEKIVADMGKVSRILGRWYAITHDDSRVKMYFRTRFRLIRQFHDGDKMSQIKDNFSVTASELDSARAILESMAMDLATNLPIPKKSQPASTGPATQGQQGAQPAPLSATNLEKQTQALNKAQKRSNSKAVQPPVASTTAQPPLQPGAQMSPTGHPMYLGKPAVTQENLQLPTARKKAKTSHQQTGASPQVQAPSPEINRQQHQQQAPEPKAPPRTVIMCPEPDCGMRSVGFPSQEALDAHSLEEHVKPNQDPLKFVKESLAEALELDAQGRPKEPSKAHAQDGPQLTASPMVASQSKQGQTPMNKLEPSPSTPMSRETSMKRQASNTGAKGAAGNKVAPGKGVASTTSPNLPRQAGAKASAGKPEMEPVHGAAAEEQSAPATIDPQELTFSLEAINKGLISDTSLYRSLTPNDTPESSKDSGSSEPNSDISENATMDIDLTWQPIEPDLLLDMNNFTMEGFDGLDNSLLQSMEMDPSMQPPLWDDLPNDFSKPFQFDPAQFSLDIM